MLSTPGAKERRGAKRQRQQRERVQGGAGLRAAATRKNGKEIPSRMKNRGGGRHEMDDGEIQFRKGIEALASPDLAAMRLISGGSVGSSGSCEG